MQAQVLISNQSGIASGEIVTVEDISHKFSSTEILREFLLSGGLYEDWSRLFSLLIITDKSAAEMKYLTDVNTPIGEDGEPYIEKAHYFIQPDTNAELYNQLLTKGEVSAPFSVVSQYLRSR